jgi:hypothetical protein
MSSDDEDDTESILVDPSVSETDSDSDADADSEVETRSKRSTRNNSITGHQRYPKRNSRILAITDTPPQTTSKRRKLTADSEPLPGFEDSLGLFPLSPPSTVRKRRPAVLRVEDSDSESSRKDTDGSSIENLLDGTLSDESSDIEMPSRKRIQVEVSNDESEEEDKESESDTPTNLFPMNWNHDIIAPPPAPKRQPVVKPWTRTEPIYFPMELCLAIVTFTKSSDLYALRSLSRNFRAAVEEKVAARLPRYMKTPPFGLPVVVYLYRVNSSVCIRCGLERCHKGARYQLTQSDECPACYRGYVQITKTVAKDFFFVTDEDLNKLQVQSVNNRKFGGTMSLYWLESVRKLAFDKFGDYTTWVAFARKKEADGNTWRHTHEAKRRAYINKLIAEKNLGVHDIGLMETSLSYKNYVRKGIPRFERDLQPVVDRMVSELLPVRRKAAQDDSAKTRLPPAVHNGFLFRAEWLDQWSSVHADEEEQGYELM